MTLPRLPRFLLTFFWAALLGALALPAQTPAGSISGVVSNSGTGDLLEGVRVGIPTLGLAVLSDATGRYVLTSVPVGNHEITANYTGLDTQRLAVVVEAGRRATRDFNDRLIAHMSAQGQEPAPTRIKPLARE